MKKAFSKIIRRTLLFVLGIINFIYAKAVHATVIYAPPEVFERERGINVVTVIIYVFALFGLISLIRFIFRIFRKK
jgi:hypothetical protein